MMRCGRVERLMAAMLDDELGARERAAVDRHLADCLSCQQALVETRALLGGLAALPAEAVVPSGLEASTLRRVRSLVHEEAAKGAGRWWRQAFLPGLAAAAAAVALVIGLGGDEKRATPPVRLARAPLPASETAVAPPAAPQPAAAPAAAAPDVPPAEPPPVLAAEPMLFVDLPILRNLEKLEHFEAISVVGVGAPGHEKGASNG